jgi:hypothetical protein
LKPIFNTFAAKNLAISIGGKGNDKVQATRALSRLADKQLTLIAECHFSGDQIVDQLLQTQVS